MTIFFNNVNYFILILMLISSLATGIVLFKTRRIEDGLVFFALLIYSATLLLNLFWGYKASISAEGKVLSEAKALLSINQSLLLQFIASMLFSIGFGIKAYAVVKKT